MATRVCVGFVYVVSSEMPAGAHAIQGAAADTTARTTVSPSQWRQHLANSSPAAQRTWSALRCQPCLDSRSFTL